MMIDNATTGTAAPDPRVPEMRMPKTNGRRMPRARTAGAGRSGIAAFALLLAAWGAPSGAVVGAVVAGSVAAATPVAANEGMGVQGLRFEGGGLEVQPHPDRVRAESAWGEAEGAVTDLLEARSADGFARQTDGEAWDRRLQSLLDRAVDRLATSEMQGVRQRLEAIRAERQALKEDIEAWRMRRATAPSEPRDQGLLSGMLSKVRGIVAPTKQSYDRRIAGAEEELTQLEQDARDLQRRFVSELTAMDIRITPEQAEGLLSMATADEITDIIAVFANMRAINEKLLNATVRSNESIATARRYYGLHAVMLEVALFAHQGFIERVDEVYLKRLEAIRREAQSLMAEARGMRTGDALDGVLDKNIEAQRLTLRAADVYRDRLLSQRARIAEGVRRLERRVAVARNTWRTVEVSSDLIAMLRTSDDAFQKLLKMEMPDLRPFESIELRDEMKRLTDQIEGPTS